MSYFKFYRPSKENPLGKITCVIPNNEDKLNFPVYFKVYNKVGGGQRWQSKPLYPGWWASYLETDHCYVEIVDSVGKTIERWEWDVFIHGDECNSSFMKWCIDNQISKGIAIGTHDGTTGEWVEPLRKGLTEAFLVEASLYQYKKLIENYRGVSGFYPLLSLITADGKDCMFYESKFGFTNSVLSEYSNSNSTVTLKKSKSLNDLICEIGYADCLDWLHIDAEGIDVELILSLDDKIIRLPKVIIFESAGVKGDNKYKIENWLMEKGYLLKDCNWNSIAIKKD